MTDKPANPAFHWACIEGAVLGYLANCEGATNSRIAADFNMPIRAVALATDHLSGQGLVKYKGGCCYATKKGRAQWNMAQATGEA